MEVRVFGVRDEFTDADIPAWQPVPVSAFQPTWPERFGYSPRFLEELIAFQPDITHTHGIWVYTSIATNRYSRRKQSPYLISTHGMLDRWAIQNSRFKKAIAHFLYEGAHLRGARCLRALCEAEARAIRELRLSNDIAIIPNGVDIPEIGNRKSEIGNPPWEGLIEPGQKVLLYLGRMHPKKGLANLIKAWAELKKNRNSEIGNQKSDWVLAIAGWDQGGHEAELKSLAAELGLSFSDVRSQKSEDSDRISDLRPPTSVVFLGPQFGDAKAACYHYSDAFILPSFSEGVPMAVLEAWVNSKPVLMTPQCNLPEGFSSSAALKMEPTVESVTNGLNEFWRMTDAERTAMGTRGYALAAGRFVWPRIAEQMKELYEWMLGGGSRPACLADF
jgi:poly(glycerol-phosphate) alpha-glucosyltransferase